MNEQDILWRIEYRSKDLEREAEQQRLAHLVHASRPKRPRFYRRALVWVGRVLVALGTRLSGLQKPVVVPTYRREWRDTSPRKS